jgi:hypothetical protein
MWAQYFIYVNYWSKEINSDGLWRWLLEKSKNIAICDYHNILVIDWQFIFLRVTVIIHNGMECPPPKKNKLLYFMACCLTCFSFSTKLHFFHNFNFSCSSNIFFINNVSRFKYQPSQLKVNCLLYILLQWCYIRCHCKKFFLCILWFCIL